MTDTASAVEPLLSVQGVSKSFSGVRALADVDLALLPGERLAVIGENGAGKSTLMKILAGIDTNVLTAYKIGVYLLQPAL